ncbi:MAG: site-specific integrase, partial [Chloroflexia bacterium]|nr:site-specific integrase [Chloroflexia bacterium]
CTTCFPALTRTKLKLLLSDADRGILPPAERLTLDKYLQRWLEDEARHRLAPQTYDRYARNVRLHLVPTLGKFQLEQLQPHQLQRLYSDLLDKGFSASLVGFVHSILHSALKSAVRMNLAPRNVADAVSPPRKRLRPFTILNTEQVSHLLETARGDRLEALYVLAVMTGMRQGELLALRWRDVDLDSAVVHVTQQMVRLKGQGRVFADPKTTYGRREIAVPAMAVQALTEHRVRQLQERRLAGSLWTDLDLVFTTHLGVPLEAHRLTAKHFKSLLRRADLPDIRFHDLRHTAATLLLGQGVNPKVVQERLGHSSIKMTMDIYSHVLPNMQADAAGKLDRLFRYESE